MARNRPSKRICQCTVKGCRQQGGRLLDPRTVQAHIAEQRQADERTRMRQSHMLSMPLQQVSTASTSVAQYESHLSSPAQYEDENMEDVTSSHNEADLTPMYDMITSLIQQHCNMNDTFDNTGLPSNEDHGGLIEEPEQELEPTENISSNAYGNINPGLYSSGDHQPFLLHHQEPKWLYQLYFAICYVGLKYGLGLRPQGFLLGCINISLAAFNTSAHTINSVYSLHTRFSRDNVCCVYGLKLLLVASSSSDRHLHSTKVQ